MQTIDVKSYETKFVHLGYRRYVHGSSMLEAMIKGIAEFVPAGLTQPVVIKTFKVIKEFDTHARIDSMKTVDAQHYPHLRQATARLDLIVSGDTYTSFVIPTTETVKDCLDTYESGDYVDKVQVYEDGRSVGKLVKIANVIDLARAVVEANKQVALKDEELTKEMEKMRWTYITNFDLLEKYEKTYTVYFWPKNVVEVKNQIFTIKKFSFNGFDDEPKSEICFYVKKGETNG